MFSSFAERDKGVNGGGWKGETVRTGVKTGCCDVEETEEDEEGGSGLLRRKRDIMLAVFVGGSVRRR